MHRLMINLLIAVGTILAAPLSWASVIPIAGIGTNGGSFTGSLDYNATSSTAAVLNVTLTNTSAGFLSGLALNNPGSLTFVTLVTPPTPAGFGLLFGPTPPNTVNASPLGNFDFGAGTGPNWEGGNPPALAAGSMATFQFALAGTNLNMLTTNSFVNAFSVNNQGNPTDNFLAVRFQGLANGDSDKVSASVVPLPAAAWLFGSGVIGLAALARRRITV